VASIVDTGRSQTTYNLTVSGPHTYHVGDDNILVHNCPIGNGPSSGTSSAFAKPQSVKVLSKSEAKKVAAANGFGKDVHALKEAIIDTDVNLAHFDVVVDKSGAIWLKTKDGYFIPSNYSANGPA